MTVRWRRQSNQNARFAQAKYARERRGVMQRSVPRAVKQKSIGGILG